MTADIDKTDGPADTPPTGPEAIRAIPVRHYGRYVSAVVALGVLVLAALGAKRIDVQLIGKAGTFAMMVAFPLFLGSHDPDLGWDELAGTLAWCFALPGLALAWVSVAAYVPLARSALAEGRVGSSP